MENEFVINLVWYDYFIWLLYTFLGAFFLYFYKSYSESKNSYLMPGYFVKVTGGLLLALFYVYYYENGDTTDYFLASREYVKLLYIQPKLYFELLFEDTTGALELLKVHKVHLKHVYWNSEEWFMIKLSSVFNFFGFNSFLGTTYFFSILSFFGSLKIIRIFNDMLPNKRRLNFWLTFLTPSILLWGSGILKDNFTLFCFNLLCNNLYVSLNGTRSWLKFILISILPAIIIYNLKAYIIICFLPFIFITVFITFVNKSKNPVAKFLIIPYFGLLVFGGLYLSSSVIIESSEAYNSKAFYSTLDGFKQWHTHLGGSAYDLGEMEYTQMGLLKKFPKAVNVTLFRPYPWECKSVVSLFAGLESFTILILTIIVLIRLRFNFFKILFKDAFIFGSFIFVLMFAFALGISAYNFGALVRFKIPLLSLYLFILAFTYNKYMDSKRKIISESASRVIQ